MEEKREFEIRNRMEREAEIEAEVDREKEQAHSFEMKKAIIERSRSQYKKEDASPAVEDNSRAKGMKIGRSNSIQSVRVSTDSISPVHVYTLAELHASYSDLHSALDPGSSFPDFLQSADAGSATASSTSATTSSASASASGSRSFPSTVPTATPAENIIFDNWNNTTICLKTITVFHFVSNFLSPTFSLTTSSALSPTTSSTLPLTTSF